MNVLVAGGAGYIGAHTVKALAEEGFKVCVLDNFSTGRRDFIRGHRIVSGDLMDKAAVEAVFAGNTFGAVFHFASLIQVGESTRDPARYYVRNLVSSLNLIGAAVDFGVEHFIFSSSAAVYGVPHETPIAENHPIAPANPYGRTKAVVENILEDYGRAYGLKSLSLRYFNAAGADPCGEMGESHDPETHLIPNILLSILGRVPRLEVFGTDFPTPDGTAVRDYIHVTDLARAHVDGLKALMAGYPGGAVNLGTNRGYSVLEIIRKAESVTGSAVPYRAAPRRPGDVPVLLASRDKAESELGWIPRHSDIEYILETAWNWHRKNV
jgi:UDP-glucose-4-epimerase GalE